MKVVTYVLPVMNSCAPEMVPQPRTTPEVESGRSPPSAEQDRLRLIRQTSPLALPLWAVGSSNRPSHGAAASLHDGECLPFPVGHEWRLHRPRRKRATDRSQAAQDRASTHRGLVLGRRVVTVCIPASRCRPATPRRSVSADPSLPVSFGSLGPHLRRTNWRGCNGSGRRAVHGRFVRRRRIGDSRAIVVLSESLSLTK